VSRGTKNPQTGLQRRRQKVFRDGGSKKRNLQNSTNQPGMSLKTKSRCGKHPNERGMSMKTNDLAENGRNVIENKWVDNWHLATESPHSGRRAGI
jgi:hypothetical protein